MADTTTTTAADDKPTTNGDFAEMDSNSYKSKQSYEEQITLYTIFNNLITTILFPQMGTKYDSATVMYRIKTSLSGNVPLLREASKNSVNHVLQWTRRGSPLRAILVVSVGTITLLALTGLLVFMLFFIAATFNAIVISLLISLAVAGGFLAIFLASVTAIYIGALSVAIFVISAATISAVIAVLIATGWIGFFWIVWLATRKSVSLAKSSLSLTGSALSAYSSARQAHHYKDSIKGSD